MTTYGEIAELVRTRVVNPSAAVDAEIPRLVHQAQLEAERRHGFMAMRSVWWLSTVAGTNATTPSFGSALPVQSGTEEFRFLRSRVTEDPYWVEFGTLPSLTVSVWSVTIQNYAAGDDRIQWTLGGGTTFQQAGFKPGMIVVAWNLGGASGFENLEGVPCYVESVVGPAMLVRAPDAQLSTSPYVIPNANAIRFTATWSQPSRTNAMRWATPVEINRIVASPQPGSDTPKYLVEEEPDAAGIPRFMAYPRNDTTTYSIGVPCFLHLGPSIEDPNEQGSATWFTNHATEYLVRAATAEAAMLEEDYEKAALWRQRADSELATLIREDRRKQPRAAEIGFSTGVHGSTRSRTPRL